MQLQASSDTAVAAAAGTGTVLTKEKLQQIVLAIQKKRAQGSTEQNDPEFSKLMQILRYVNTQQQQQQQQQRQQQPATPVTTDKSKAEAEAEADAPAAEGKGKQQPEAPQFSSDDIAQLRRQIHAFRLVSKNMPLPAQLRKELWASGLTEAEKRQLDAPPGGQDSASDKASEATNGTQQPKTPAGGVRLELPALPQSVGFVSPHMLLREKLAAGGEQGARLQRLLVPSITPSGLDVRAMAQERARRREARIEYRMQELAAAPAAARGADDDVDGSARLRALVELKALGLRHKQRALRTEVARSISRASQLGVAGDRSALRRMKKQSQREARLTEKMERQQRHERERREQDQHKQQLQAITDHGANLVAWHRVQQQRMDRLGRAVVALHSRVEREEAKRRERIKRERVQALKEGDEEAYLKLVDKEKDTRITHLLRQTDEYLTTLIDAVQRQQHSTPAVGNDDGDDAPSWLKENADMDTDDGEAAQHTKDEYYRVAHRTKERIRQQPRILVGGTLKDYQLHGLEWMVSLYNNRLNGILADEMGLGKTIQTISLVTYLIEMKQQAGPFLIIVPLSTITNWILEFEKWAPSVRVIGYKGNPTQRRMLQQQIRRGDFQVLLTTYDYIIKDRPILSKISWVHMVIDEGHRMKNANSKLASTLSVYYKTRYRLILTGTPLQNNLPELWALLNFVLPNIFSSAQNFDEWFNAPFANAGGQDRIELNEEEQLLVIKRLHKVLRPFLLRRLKKDVEVDLPDKVEHVIKCAMSAVQSRLYTQMLRFNTLFRGVRVDGGGGSRASFNNTIMQLRKICNHPFVFDEVEARINPALTSNDLLFRAAGKFELLDRVLSKLLATNHKVLIFFQMTQIMTIMQDFLEWRGIASLRLDGSTSDDDRREYMRVFNAPDSKFMVFLLSTRAGGQGLNLQTADTVVIFDSDWNPSADAQAMDRAHRIGQRNEVRILRLITRGTVEESILARAEYKRDLDGKIIQAGKFDNKTTAEEREQILRSLLKSEEMEEVEAAAEEMANSDEEINDMLARSDDERVIFARLDKERRARELQDWRDAGHTGAPPERLFTEAELPEEYLHDYDPAEEQRKREEAMREKARITKRVYYDDGLSEEQWLDALENDSVDLDDVIRKKREKEERQRKKHNEKLAQQHLRAKLPDGAAPTDDDDNGGNEMGGASADQSTPARRSRSRRAGSSATSAAPTPGASGLANGDGESGAATPLSSRKPSRKRQRTADPELDAGAATPGMATPTAASARKSRRKTSPADLLPPEERARLNGIFDAAFAVVESSVDPEYNREHCQLFLELPSKRDYPDYYVIIRHPIAMKTIRRNVKAGRYASVDDFHRDWKTMFDNARTYNEEGSMVYDDACILQRALEDKLSEMTGESFSTPVATQAPLPAAFSAALKQQQQQQQQTGAGAPPPAAPASLDPPAAAALPPQPAEANNTFAPPGGSNGNADDS
ncbi:ATP-dependent DNA helicase Snf21 [Coemansia sp. RSA 552]|nr:ATP-dependent DNA helicase Snf21 [Coemansia sp. RSA 552]